MTCSSCNKGLYGGKPVSYEFVYFVDQEEQRYPSLTEANSARDANGGRGVIRKIKIKQ